MSLPGVDDVVAPIILFSDQTHLSQNGKEVAWPLVLTTANVSLDNRWEPHGHVLLATLPDIKKVPYLSSEQKTAVLHAALQAVLAPLKKASHE